MLFNVSLAGHPAVALVDTGACGKTAYLSAGFCEKHNLRVQRRTDLGSVRLANGSQVSLTGTCTLGLQSGSIKHMLQCTVLQLNNNFDVVLTDNWLRTHLATLDWHKFALTVRRPRKTVAYSLASPNPTPPPVTGATSPTQDAQTQQIPILTAKQYARAVRKAGACIMVWVGRGAEGQVNLMNPNAQTSQT